MSTQRNDPPVDTVRDGQTFIKIWRNWLPSGDPIYSSTVGYTYTDKETGKARDSRSLRDTDLLKMPDLASRARQSLRQFREADRAKEPSPERANPRPDYQHGTGQPPQDQRDGEDFRQSRRQARGPAAQAPDYSR